MSAEAKLPLYPNAWQQMRENYKTIVLEYDNFSEKYNIEYAFWQLNNKRRAIWVIGVMNLGLLHPLVIFNT